MSLNVYFLDIDPAAAARALDDGRLLRAPGYAATALRDATAMRLAMHEGRSLRRSEAKHPRHPIPRAVARSNAYASWVYDFGREAAAEVRWRGLLDDVSYTTQHEWCELAELAPVDPVRRVVVEPDAHPYEVVVPPPGWLLTVPQRLDGAQDLAVPGDPVTAYRRWYAATRIPGAGEAWVGANAAWTRREPPAWLAELGVRVERIDAPGDARPTWGAFALA